ncbi:hypothetical protein FDP41_008729 [Naegleria fowleri]|uniref:Uncharacterized protein n=1 Tax=Naegleria fowleri TaxID=5763 RepID=A0A6A5BGE2_NAEFO|nr:uncharacterized protein FDP41_008729 [Naegleria fowleri]KAF0973065.1 hypothetical protein FDP41_008729 [Naegleria fowleri]CAG4713172.1 unnamed protein product [Naegleria fowleri]
MTTSSCAIANSSQDQVRRVIYRSDNEIRRLQQEEEKKKRISRLKAVREMAKSISRNKTKEYQLVKEKETQENIQQVKRAWQERKDNELQQLQEEIEKAKQKIGEAHRNAQLFHQQYEEELKRKERQQHENTRKAQHRFEKCMKVVKSEQAAKEQLQQEKEYRMEKAKNLEYPAVEQVQNGFEKLFAVPSNQLNNVIAAWNPIQKREEAPQDFVHSFHHKKQHVNTENPQSEKLALSQQVNPFVVKHFEPNKGLDVNNQQAEKDREEKKQLAVQRAIMEKKFAKKAAEKLRMDKLKTTLEKELEHVQKIDIQQKVDSLTDSSSRNTLADNQFKKKKQIELEKKFEDLFRARMPDLQDSSYF